MRPLPSRTKVLVFVVAYEAQATLADVLNRIPPLGPHVDLEVLVIDDSSSDRTFEVGLRARVGAGCRVTVLYNPTNQGYGGNQKLGYAYAIRNGFDVVVLLHGDGQYAPDRIPALLQPLVDGEADAVLGSRMLVRGAARRGRMPLYKFVGNRMLTWCQNRLLRTSLSEFHSGFRAYRVAALAKIPFQYNANAFHFDTEIIVQLVMAGFRIVEVPIPTYYGDEICRVNGVRYAIDVLQATVGSRLHAINLLYDRKFDVEESANRHYPLKLGFRSSHTMAIDAVPPGSRVLDVGCGTGLVAAELARKGCAVDGADQFAPAEPHVFETFHVWHEPDPLPVDLRAYDVVLLLDVLEHLTRPERLLDAMRASARSLGDRPRLIATTGNVAFFVVRLQALLGRFNYGKRGILDLTHTRLYTFKTLRRLFEQCGYRVIAVAGVPAPFPLALGDTAIARAALRINELLIRLMPGVFAYQVFMEVVPTPSVEALLDSSMTEGTRRADALAISAGGRS
jgi:glycosyltransferase involved in cell wall biosynthesis